VNRTFLVKIYTAIEIASGTEKVKVSLAVVALIRVVDVRLREDKDLSSKRVPLDLSTIGLEEALLASRRRLQIE
jgi:hypothetical protein